MYKQGINYQWTPGMKNKINKCIQDIKQGMNYH